MNRPRIGPCLSTIVRDGPWNRASLRSCNTVSQLLRSRVIAAVWDGHDLDRLGSFVGLRDVVRDDVAFVLRDGLPGPS